MKRGVIHPERHDVVVVGAGLAGLSAAYRLHTSGARVIVLEAAEEVGGRTRSRSLDGDVVDFGAEWLGARHVHLLALLNELGIATRPARQIYYPILWRGTARVRLLAPRLPLREAAAVSGAIWKASRLARGLSAEEPWRSRGAKEMDRISFGAWLRSLGIRGDGYYFFDQVIGALSSTSIDRLSLLHVLWWIRRGAGPARIVRTTFQRRIPAGAQAVANALADRLSGKIVLGEPATAISHSSQGIEITTRADEWFRARRAIVTAPLGTLNRIAFDPPLPSRLAELDQLTIGPATKVIAHLTTDRSPPHRMFVGGQSLAAGWRTGSRLTGFALDPTGDASPDELIADLARGFEVPTASLRNPSIYRWSDHPHIPGCDIGFAPGQLTRHGPHLRQSFGHIHFAGAERSSWPNNMEGAVESGTRAARRVISAR